MSKRDNQGVDLEAARRHLETEARLTRETGAEAHRRHLELVKVCPYADWTTVDGVLCLRSGNSNYVAVPVNGAQTSAKGERSSHFDVVSLEPREFVVQLKRGEVRNWLWRRHIAEKGL